MSQITYRANLSAKVFPFISDNWGRTVIQAGPDNTFNRQVSSAEDLDRDAGIPQIYYCHNVMPFAQGFQSVGYLEVAPSSIYSTTFSFIFLLRDNLDNKAYLGVDASGAFYINTGGTWVSKITVLGAAGKLITTAYVQGTTYIYVSNIGCYKYDFGTGVFIAVTLTSLDPTQVLGIFGAVGYLLTFNIATVAWSSTIDPTDFTPSLVTGAGSGSVEGARGGIIFVIPHLLGFIVYTSANAVAGIYSGNARFPFNFREIVGSGGTTDISLVANDAGSSSHYAYTTSGLQLVSTSYTSTTNPEITDFISGKLFEDFNTTTNTFSQTVLTSTMKKAVSVISERYLVVSYGITELTHALVYDIVQKRYGKLKITHVASFEYELTNPGVTEIPKQAIGFMQKDGRIVTVDFNVYSNATGVMVCGKYQYVRSRLLQLDSVILEDIITDENFTLKVWAALDGKVNVETTPTLLSSAGKQQIYGCRAEGVNISLLFKGQFKVESLVLAFNVTGRR